MLQGLKIVKRHDPRSMRDDVFAKCLVGIYMAHFAFEDDGSREYAATKREIVQVLLHKTESLPSPHSRNWTGHFEAQTRYAENLFREAMDHHRRVELELDVLESQAQVEADAFD